MTCSVTAQAGGDVCLHLGEGNVDGKWEKSQEGSQDRLQVPGELFKTENAETMSTLRLERFPQNVLALLTLIFKFHGHGQDLTGYTW